MRRRALLLALAALPLARAARAGSRVLLRGGGLVLELGPQRVVSAIAGADPYSGWTTLVTLTPEAAVELAAFTEALVGQTFEVVFDGRVIMTPRVQEPIASGAFMISGLSKVEAHRLASFLKGEPG